MKKYVRTSLLAALAAGTLAFSMPAAEAMPVADKDIVSQNADEMGVKQTRWVCRYGRCWWRPGWRRYWRPYYRPYYWRPYPYYW